VVGSLEKQEIDDYESDNHATGAPNQHVMNIVPGHALSRFGSPCHAGIKTLAFLSEMDAAPLSASSGPTSSQQDGSKSFWH
jgi:hypothetical protein